MAASVLKVLSLGAGQTGLNLKAALATNPTTTQLVIHPTARDITGFVEIGAGNYLFYHPPSSGQIPDDFRGAIVFYTGVLGLVAVDFTGVTVKAAEALFPAADVRQIFSSDLAPQKLKSTYINDGGDPTAYLDDSGTTLSGMLGQILAAAQAAGTGDGNTPVDHNTGGADALRYLLAGGAPADDVRVEAYLKSEYDAGVRTIRGVTYTGTDGRWLAPLMLNSGVAYKIVAWLPGVTQAVVTEVTP